MNPFNPLPYTPLPNVNIIIIMYNIHMVYNTNTIIIIRDHKDFLYKHHI